LGSSSYITNLDGEVVQHVEYVPFGEVFLEEKNAVWNTPYLFNGKELDKETGMSYYGARYYEPKTSVWLSVDPKFAEFPEWSPYNYCFQNPINFIDPDGRTPKPPHYIMAFFNNSYDRTVEEKRLVSNFYSLVSNVQDNSLRFFGHGYFDHITIQQNRKDEIRLFTPVEINKYLGNSTESKKWKNMQKNGGTFISYGCSTGQENGIIDQFSDLKGNEKILFVAPTKFVHPSLDTDTGNVYVFNSKNDVGQWNIYNKGEIVGTRPNGWQPTEIDP
jgi:RHS repeat-associated protein